MIFVTALLALPAVQEIPATRSLAPTLETTLAGDEAPLVRVLEVRVLEVGDLTGADRLAALLEAIEDERLDVEVRLAALERYDRLHSPEQTSAHGEGLASAVEAFCSVEGGISRISTLGPDKLLLIASQEAQDWVDGLLSDLRAFKGRGGLIDVESRFFTAPTGTFDDLRGQRSALALGAAETEDLLRRMDDMSVLTSPRVLTHAASRATMSILDESAYIKDYALTVLPDQDIEVADPVVDVLRTGTTIELLAIPVAEDRVALHVGLTISSAERPFPSVEQKIGRHKATVTVQQPVVKTAKLDARLELGEGDTMVAFVESPEDESEELVILLRAKRVASETVEDELKRPR